MYFKSHTWYSFSLKTSDKLEFFLYSNVGVCVLLECTYNILYYNILYLLYTKHSYNTKLDGNQGEKGNTTPYFEVQHLFLMFI